MRNPKKVKRGRKSKAVRDTTALHNFGQCLLCMEDTDDVDFDEIDKNERLLKKLGF